MKKISPLAMKPTRSVKYLGFASAIALIAAAPTANAQVVDEEDSTRKLETVTVSAQKTDENLQDVSAAVSSIGGETVDAFEILDNRDLQYVTPSVSFGDAVNSRVRSTVIRGLGTLSLSEGVETSVGTFVDGVVMGREFQAFNNFSDIERIEVLRGPQGTLFGKNASAGLIHVITKDPEREFGGDISLGYGSDNEIRSSAGVTGPLGDNAAYRLSGFFNSRDGIVDNAFLNTEVNDAEDWGVRGKLSFDLSPDTNLLLTADYSQGNAECCEQTPRFANAAADAVLVSFGLPSGLPSESNRSSVANTGAVQDTENWGLSSKLEHDFGSFNLVSITAYREGDIFEFAPADSYPTVIIDQSGSDGKVEQFSQELRLHSEFEGSFNFIAGAYYYRSEQDSTSFVNDIHLWRLIGFPFAPLPFDVTGQVAGLQRVESHADVTNDNFAVFGQGTLDVTDQFRLIGGLRYTEDEVDATRTQVFNNLTIPVPYDPTIFGPMIPPNAVFIPFPDGMGGTVPAPIVPVPAPFFSPPQGTVINLPAEEEDLSYRIAAEYDVNEDVMLYASYAKGYKGPGVDVQVTSVVLPGQEDLAIVDAEFIYTTELGLRSTLFDDTATFNLTFFHTEAEDLQAGQVQGVSLLLNNVGEVENTGVEAEFVALPTDNLQISGFVSYQDAEIKSFAGEPGLVGERPQRTPEWSYSIQGQHTTNLPSLGLDLVTNLSYSWRDEERVNLQPGDVFLQDAYGLLDASITFNTPDGKYAFSLWGRNLTDEAYASLINDNSSALSLPDGSSYVHILGRERYFGASLKAKF